MIRLSENGAYIVNGEVLEDGPDIRERLGKFGVSIAKEEAKKNTLAYGILRAHNKSEDMKNLKLKFDCLAGFSTLQNYIKLYKPQKCGIFLSNFLNLFVVWCCILIKSMI